MEEVSFLTQALSMLILLVICCFTYILSKKINFPYTVLLVIVGLLLVPLSKLHFFNFIDDFSLTPDLLFFVLLPVLLFEAAYNMNYRQLMINWKTITSLAVFWLLISTIIIAFALFFVFPLVWFQIPFLVCLLFWALISATDPVAVLAIFKTLWAPRRLTILFEWESLFNDGTSVAMFLVVLWLIIEWWDITTSTYVWWFLKFASMVWGWIIFWSIIWFIFSKIIGYINNHEDVEIVMTIILAHLTFIFSELINHHFPFIPISWVIATIMAAIVIWNYWRYKITPRVEAHMHKFWEFFAFIANSLVFILMWLILSTVNINFWEFIIPIFVTILVVMIARVISVYIPIWLNNIFKIEEHIPNSWTILLSWWSLRWALALMMVLLIPWLGDPEYSKILAFQESVWWAYSYSIKDFLLVLTIWSIMFTLFIKAPLTTVIMKKLKVDKLHKLEEFEYEEWKILSNLKILQKLNLSFKKSYLTKVEYEELKDKYNNKLEKAVKKMKTVLDKKWEEPKILIKRALSLHALWIEKQYLKDLFFYNEIDERNFKYILRRIDKQIERLDSSNEQLRSISKLKNDYDIFSRIFVYLYKRTSTEVDSYIRNRTRVIITRKVIKELKLFSEIDFGFDKLLFDEVIDLYALFNKQADEKRIKIFASHKDVINVVEARLVNKSLLKLEEKTIKDLYSKEIITPKLYIKFMDDIESEIFSDVKKA